MNRVSVIICAHNSARRLQPTLEGLARCRTEFPVEVILVDNRSTDGTAERATEFWKTSGNYRFEFFVIHEPQPGLAYARRAGIKAASGNILVFCDDDNWLCPDYLQIAGEIMRDNPEIGVLGGQSFAHFESEPPAWFLRNKQAFAVGEQGEQEGDVTETRSCVWGAGFVVRVAALLELRRAGVTPVCVGRTGNLMKTGEDIEMCYHLREIGWRIWYSPRLKLTHYIPASRFNLRKFRLLTVENGIFLATVQYPFFGNRGRLEGSFAAIRAYVAALLRRRPNFELAREAVLLVGQLSGFALERASFETSRRNKIILQSVAREGNAQRSAIIVGSRIDDARQVLG